MRKHSRLWSLILTILLPVVVGCGHAATPTLTPLPAATRAPTAAATVQLTPSAAVSTPVNFPAGYPITTTFPVGYQITVTADPPSGAAPSLCGCVPL